MKKVYVYAYENKDTQGQYRIINFPGTNRPMLCPFYRKEILANGVWSEENKFKREMRRFAHNLQAPSTYSDDEQKGRTAAQARISEIFEQSCHCPSNMPILDGNGAPQERIIVVELDLDNPSDVKPLTLAANERLKLQDWVAKKRDAFLREQQEQKQTASASTPKATLTNEFLVGLSLIDNASTNGLERKIVLEQVSVSSGITLVPSLASPALVERAIAVQEGVTQSAQAEAQIQTQRPDVQPDVRISIEMRFSNGAENRVSSTDSSSIEGEPGAPSVASITQSAKIT